MRPGDEVTEPFDLPELGLLAPEAVLDEAITRARQERVSKQVCAAHAFWAEGSFGLAGWHRLRCQALAGVCGVGGSEDGRGPTG
jgi:hypothetical protein